VGYDLTGCGYRAVDTLRHEEAIGLLLSLCLNKRGDLVVFISVCRLFHNLLPLVQKCRTKLCHGAILSVGHKTCDS